MTRYVLARLAASVPVFLLVSLMAFGIIWLVPGDPAAMFLDAGATADQLARLRTQLGLDKPLPQQMWEWYGRLAVGDLGESILLRRPVTEAILERLPVTLSLTALALVLAIVLGVAAGVFAAIKRDGWADQATMTVALLGLSAPDFWLGLVLIIVFAVGLGWFPTGGYVPFGENPLGWLRAMALPALTLALVQVGFIARMTRSSMLEVLGQDFVRTADAKGLSRARIVVAHALPNALVPVVTVIGIIAGSMLGGAVVIEQVFSLPGVGRLVIGAVLSRDFPVIQGGLLFLALIYLAVNLIVDILYVVVDPRVRLQ